MLEDEYNAARAAGRDANAAVKMLAWDMFPPVLQRYLDREAKYGINILEIVTFFLDNGEAETINAIMRGEAIETARIRRELASGPVGTVRHRT